MDYNYIYLQNQIKALMNRNYVCSSSHSKFTEELRNGGNTLSIDTLQNYFEFGYAGINNPIYIDPINKKLINVEFIGDIDLTKLVSSLQNGYGIDIENMGGGVFKISVKYDLFATKEELENVNERFNDYMTTEELALTYATKDELKNVDDKFNGYTTTEELALTYATKDEVKNVDDKFNDYATKEELKDVDDKFNNYTTTEDLEANYAKKSDIVPDSKFIEVNGFPYYYVKNEDITTSQFTNNEKTYNKLTINIPDEVKNSINSSSGLINIFKIVLRKNVVFDSEGVYTKEFLICRDNGHNYNPIITLNNNYCVISNCEDEELFIAFDVGLNINPYTLYMNGDLSIMYLLNQDLIQTNKTIKCKVIDADNALKLYKSDVKYFYKPDIITDVKIDDVDFYKMIFKIPNDYTIPANLNFKFIEHCFGNEWSLIWDGEKWTGDNMQGRSNGKIVSSKKYLRVDKKYNDYGAIGCFVRCKHDEWNEMILNENSENNLMRHLFSSGNTYLKFKNGELKKGNTERMEIDRYMNVDAYNSEGYDYLPLYLRINNSDSSYVNDLLNRIDKIYLDCTINGALNRLTFRFDAIHQDQNYGYYVDLIPELDSVEKINSYWNKSNIDTTKKDIELYLRKDYTDPIEEINWDNSTNAFNYIIQQQFYEITPNPNAASTLYTDFNITSSKIITADNITTMRSDLNLVTNTVDVVSYDVRDVKNNVETLNSQMAEQKLITKDLRVDVDNNRIIACTALAFGIAGTVGSITSIGMQLGSTGINFASNTTTVNGRIYNAINDANELPLFDIVNDPFIAPLSTRSISSDLTTVYEFCNNPTTINDKEYENDEENPKYIMTSLYNTYYITNQYRESIKPHLKLLANKIEEIDTSNTNVSDELQQLQNDVNDKLNEKVNNEVLNNYVSKDELKRIDTVDAVAKINEGNITLEFEDVINDGLIVFQIHKSTKSAVTIQKRRFYIKIVDGLINDYKGVQTETTIDGVVIKPLSHSEEDRTATMPNAVLNDKIITINITDVNIIIKSVIIENNTCTRNIVKTVDDLAYVSDIEALDNKINSLTEMNLQNIATLSEAQDTYATVEEVNEVLTNNYVLKTDYEAKITELENRLSALETLIANVYNKTEADEKYLSKNNVINQTICGNEIGITNFDSSRFIFEDVTLLTQMKENGFVLKCTLPTQPLFSDFEDKFYYISGTDVNNMNFRNNDKTGDVSIVYYGLSPTTNDKLYNIYYYDKTISHTYDKYVSIKLYFIDEQSYNSYNVYCKEIVDGKLKALT